MRITHNSISLFLSALLIMPAASQAITWEKGDTKVNFHGSLRLSVNSDDCGSPCKGPWRNGASGENLAGKSSIYASSNFSHFQFDGSHKLSDKTSAIFKTEWRIQPSLVDEGDGDSDSLTDFEQFLGLKGSFGKVRIGTILTPYMQSGVKLDPFRRDAIAGRFFVDIYSALHHTNGFGRGRATNTIRYDSPKFAGGLTAQAFLTLDQSSNDDHAMGFGLMYNTKSVYALLQHYDANTEGESSATKIGGKYKFGKAGSVFAQFESDGGLISMSEGLSPAAPQPPSGNLTVTGSNAVEGADVWVLGGTYNIKKTTLILQVGERSDTNTATNGHSGLVVGASVRLDKNFYYYVGFLQKDFNSATPNDERLSLGATFTW